MASSKPSDEPYVRFNKHLKTFFRECDNTFPDLVCFKVMMAIYKILKSMSKALPQKFFQELFVLHHGDGFKQRKDDSVFDPKYTAPPLYASMIETMKARWIALDKYTKDTIYDHLIVLMALSDRCIEHNTSHE